MKPLLPLLLLAGIGCVRTVHLHRATAVAEDPTYVEVVVDVDADLKSLDYFIDFQWWTTDDGVAPKRLVTDVEFFGKFHGTTGLDDALARGKGAAVADPADGPGPPWTVRMRVLREPLSGARRYLVKLWGSRPYSGYSLDSNFVPVTLPP